MARYSSARFFCVCVFSVCLSGFFPPPHAASYPATCSVTLSFSHSSMVVLVVVAVVVLLLLLFVVVVFFSF
jgi:hypothetical protein